MKIRIAGLINDSIVDGLGLRYGIYVQGCPHFCVGCHNPQSHDFQGGKEMDTAEIWQKIESNPLLDGITFSGGEPMCQPKPLLELAKAAREAGLNVWCYTGYTWEELIKDDGDIKKLLNNIDILVDGPYIEKERSLSLKFRGSGNQRIIDAAKSLATGHVIMADI